MSISKILEGINRDESSYTDGWWETESGASFGHGKLIEAQGYEAGLLAKITELESQVDALRKDAKRYQWLCDKGYNYHGAMAGSGSMSICRGPYIRLEPPSVNNFSNMILGKPAADAIIDAAIKGEQA